MDDPTPKEIKKRNAAANKLQCPDERFIEEWTELLKHPIEKDEHSESVVIFRLLNEWYALSTSAIVEVSDLKKFHKIPHIKFPAFLGTTSFRGQLWLGINLSAFLGIKAHAEEDVKSCMLAIEKENRRWVFPVDEVYGVHHFERQILDKSFMWKDKQISYLNSEVLFRDLERSMS